MGRNRERKGADLENTVTDSSMHADVPPQLLAHRLPDAPNPLMPQHHRVLDLLPHRLRLVTPQHQPPLPKQTPKAQQLRLAQLARLELVEVQPEVKLAHRPRGLLLLKDLVRPPTLVRERVRLALGDVEPSRVGENDGRGRRDPRGGRVPAVDVGDLGEEAGAHEVGPGDVGPFGGGRVGAGRGGRGGELAVLVEGEAGGEGWAPRFGAAEPGGREEEGAVEEAGHDDRVGEGDAF